ncbi:hypothetical protein Gotur_034113 [Gossypium turneri]
MDLEEFPSHIIEKIKYTWETWNSPPRLSSDSLHLDEIEEMNLDNMQEAVPKVTMTQAVIEAVINVSMLCGINHDHAKRNETWK